MSLSTDAALVFAPGYFYAADMLRNSKILTGLAIVLFLSVAGSIQAGLDPKADDTMKTVLSRQTGQTVELRLKSGEKISGKVALVGASLVHLTPLTGAEFYEAVVLLDDVAAVVAREKTK